MTEPADPQSRVSFTPEICALINRALESGNPLLLAAVGAGGEPLLSFRGSAQVFDEARIGLWLRNTQGETLDALRRNPNVAMMYRSAEVPFLQFRGQARIVEDEANRNRVFELSPEREQRADPGRTGVAILIDIRKIEGVLGFVEGRPNRFTMG